MKATSSWWKKKITYDSESVAWQLASTKDSEKHQRPEESKKNQTQILSLNVPEVLIDQWELNEQKKKDDSEKVFIEEDEDWYEIILQSTKNLQIQKEDKLMICEWSHWITCHNNECQKHYQMKKWNQYYSQESWEYISRDKKKWLRESLYEASTERW